MQITGWWEYEIFFRWWKTVFRRNSIEWDAAPYRKIMTFWLKMLVFLFPRRSLAFYSLKLGTTHCFIVFAHSWGWILNGLNYRYIQTLDLVFSNIFFNSVWGLEERPTLAAISLWNDFSSSKKSIIICSVSKKLERVCSPRWKIWTLNTLNFRPFQSHHPNLSPKKVKLSRLLPFVKELISFVTEFSLSSGVYMPLYWRLTHQRGPYGFFFLCHELWYSES